MKTKILVAAVSGFCILHSAQQLRGQGALTPPGAPAPTMKSLDQIEARTPISSVPLSITSPGSYYLTTNILGVAFTNGITISADNVVLDLNGFSLVGNGGLNGIYVPNPVRNLWVQNGVIRGWPQPILAGQAFNSRFERLLLANNGGGLNVGTNCTVTGCQVDVSSVGIFADVGSTISDCTVADCFSYGFFTTDDATLRNCMSRANGAQGIVAGNRCTIQDCTVVSNANNGIHIGSNSSLLNCRVIANLVTGIVASASCVMKDCLAQANQGDGIQVGVSSMVTDCSSLYNMNGIGINGTAYCRVTGCTVVSNRFQGIYCGDNSLVSGCLVCSNGSIGIQAGNNNLVTDNNCFGNAVGSLAGIFVFGSGNRIEGNLASGNQSRGIEVTASGNVIIRNTCHTNANQNVNFDIAPGNFVSTIVSDPTSLNAPTNNANINISF